MSSTHSPASESPRVTSAPARGLSSRYVGKSTSAHCRLATTKLRVALYDWQTGERLPARDLETDEVSDMHMLHRFRLD